MAAVMVIFLGKAKVHDPLDFNSIFISLQVRNAIQALQDFTFSSIQSQADLNSRFPARSIPNISNDSEPRNTDTEHGSMVRSTSHPPEMWGRELSTESYKLADPFEKLGLDFLRKPSMNYNLPEVSSATQTENCDYETIYRIVRTNPRLVLSILGRNLLAKYHKMSLSTIAELSREPSCDLLAEESETSKGTVTELVDINTAHISIVDRCHNNSNTDNNEAGHKSNENNHIKGTRHKIEKHVSIVEAAVVVDDDGNNNADSDSPVDCGPLNDSEQQQRQLRQQRISDSGHGESCVIVLNEDEIDVIPEGNVKKRYNNLIIKKTPVSNRFSAGDVDTLEKGLVSSMPSTRSLKEI